MVVALYTLVFSDRQRISRYQPGPSLLSESSKSSRSMQQVCIIELYVCGQLLTWCPDTLHTCTREIIPTIFTFPFLLSLEPCKLHSLLGSPSTSSVWLATLVYEFFWAFIPGRYSLIVSLSWCLPKNWQHSHSTLSSMPTSLKPNGIVLHQT